jgi:hypothetical protein
LSVEKLTIEASVACGEVTNFPTELREQLRGLGVSPAWLASILAATGGYLATQDEFRWLAWLFLVPMFAVKENGRWRWTLFSLMLNGVLLVPYLLALGLETEDSRYALILYLLLVAITVLPYLLLDWVEACRFWPKLAKMARLSFLATSITAIWLVSDHFLATKYWYALALDPAPLWVVRTFGEEGLALAMVCSSLMIAMALRQSGLRCLFALVACAGMLGYLFSGNPLIGATRNWPALDILAVQSYAGDGIVDETRRNLAGMSIARHAGWQVDLILLPELTGFSLDGQNPELAPYQAASRYYDTSILINGSRPTSVKDMYERSSGMVRAGTLADDFVAKRRLFPYYESRRGKSGTRWTAGPTNGLRLLPHDDGFIIPLLCFEVLDRGTLRRDHTATGVFLVTVAADTSRFRHPAVGRYLIHAAAFQSQLIRKPVLITNNAGPSGILFPDGTRVVAFRRGEAGVFRVAPDGSVSTLSLRL